MSREQPRIAYLGPKDSYAGQAASNLFPGSEFHHLPIIHLEDVLQAVQCGTVDRAVVPFQNSSNGMVIEALDMFSERVSSYPNVYICGEGFLEIDHCLLGFPHHTREISPPQTPPRTPLETEQDFSTGTMTPKPMIDFDQIKHVYSHSQSLRQCSKFLSKYLPHASLNQVSSTAAAAHIAAHDPEGRSVSIGSASVLKNSHVTFDVLVDKIQDAPDNTTRFLILKRVNPTFHYEPGSVEDQIARRTGESRMILVSFIPDTERPQALADAFTIFRNNNLGVKSITSRPSHEGKWDLRYFVELEFVWDEVVANTHVNNALKELGTVARERNCHGGWGNTLRW